jgi:hypothetical protein
MDAMTPPGMLQPQMPAPPVAALAMPPQPAAVTHDALLDERKKRRNENQRRHRAKQGDGYNAKHRVEARKWRSQNQEKCREYARKYRANDPDKVRSINLKKKYGITLAQFNERFLSQASRCAICKGVSSTGKNWHVDHCHQTGKIRGILCHPCNLMIGHARDKVDTLLAAVEYLK